jgi:hypothetical protein
MRTSHEAAAEQPAGLRGFYRDAVRFFFQPSDTATFGLIRICGGLMALYVHLVYSFDLYAVLGKDALVDHELMTRMRLESPVDPVVIDWEYSAIKKPLPEQTPAEAARLQEYKAFWRMNYDPRLTLDKGQYVWSAWFHVTDPAWMVVVHVVILAAMLLFALGLWTPVTGVMSWLGALCYVSRAQTMLFGMDQMMMILLCYLMLGYLFTRPSNTALSLDRLLWRYRMARQAGAPGLLAADAAETTSVSINFAIRMMQIHFCIIYFAAGISKLLGSTWWSGNALWLTMANYEFAPLHLKYYHEMVAALARHRWLWELATWGGVVFTLVLEIGFPVFIWSPRFRWLCVAGAALLHTGIALIMGLTGFGVMMLALVASFVPNETVRRLLGITVDRVPGLAARDGLTPLPGAVGFRQG